MRSGVPDHDTHLIRAVAGGDAEALNQLYQQYGLAILNWLTAHLGDRALAEDVLQEVMLAVWKGAANFRGESRVRTWLFAIARRQMLKARGKRIRSDARTIPHSEQIDMPSGQHDPLILQNALDQLPADQQAALELVFYHDLSGQEAANQLGVPLNTLKSRLLRARRHLREILEKDNSDA